MIKHKKQLAIAALLVVAVLLFAPVSFDYACEYEPGGIDTVGTCMKQFRSPAGISAHPLVAIFLGLCFVTAGMAWLLKRPAPHFIDALMSGKGWRFTIARWLLYVLLSAGLLLVYIFVPILILDRLDTRYTGYAWLLTIAPLATYFFLVVFGPNDVGGKPWRGSRQPSALLGPDRADPPDARRY